MPSTTIDPGFTDSDVSPYFDTTVYDLIAPAILLNVEQSHTEENVDARARLLALDLLRNDGRENVRPLRLQPDHSYAAAIREAEVQRNAALLYMEERGSIALLERDDDFAFYNIALLRDCTETQRLAAMCDAILTWINEAYTRHRDEAYGILKDPGLAAVNSIDSLGRAWPVLGFPRKGRIFELVLSIADDERYGSTFKAYPVGVDQNGDIVTVEDAFDILAADDAAVV